MLSPNKQMGVIAHEAPGMYFNMQLARITNKSF